MKNQRLYIKKLKKILTKDEFIEFRIDKDALIDLGCSYMEIEDYKKAFKIFSIGLKLIGYDIDILNGIGVSLCELGKFRVSKSVLEIANDLFPEDATTLANLAGVYWERGDLPLAIYNYNKSLKKDSSIIETHLNLINLYYEQGDLFMAYISTLNLLNIYPNDDQALAIRNDIIVDLGMSVI